MFLKIKEKALIYPKSSFTIGSVMAWNIGHNLFLTGLFLIDKVDKETVFDERRYKNGNRYDNQLTIFKKIKECIKFNFYYFYLFDIWNFIVKNEEQYEIFNKTIFSRTPLLKFLFSLF